MKKFLVLMHGPVDATPEGMAAMRAWFGRIAAHVVDSGNPLGAAVEVTAGGPRALGPDDGAAVGYTILAAASLEEAAALLDGCPMAGSARVHEALPM